MELESPYPGKAHQPQEQRYPFLPVIGVCRCVQTMVYGCQCLGFLTCAQMLIDEIAHGGCPDTGGEFALKLTLGEHSLPPRGLNLRIFKTSSGATSGAFVESAFRIASDRMKYAPFQLHVTCVMHNG